MDLDILLLVGFVGIILGALINQLINNLGDKGKSTPSAPKQTPLLELRRDSDSGRLLVAVDGEETDTSNRLDKNQRDLVQRLILELNDWLEPIKTIVAEADVIQSDEEYKTEKEEADESVPRPSFNPVTVLVRALQADVKKSQLPTESIVSQINDILQADLKNASNIKDPVRLMEWPGRGMVVMIGLDKYDSVDEVPDEDIKAVIKAAVKEWEQQGLPK